MSLDILIEIMVSALLVTTVGYCYILNKKLSNLRNNNEAFNEAINNMNIASKKAENVISSLKLATLDAERKINEQDEKTKTLKSELSLLVRAAQSLEQRRKEIQTERSKENETPNKSYRLHKAVH